MRCVFFRRGCAAINRKTAHRFLSAPGRDSNPEPTDYETGWRASTMLDQARCNSIYEASGRQSWGHLATSDHLIAPFLRHRDYRVTHAILVRVTKGGASYGIQDSPC